MCVCVFRAGVKQGPAETSQSQFNLSPAGKKPRALSLTGRPA